MLQALKEETGCGIACDLPHFFLSAFSANLNDVKIHAIAEKLDPRQLHVGGLSLSNDGYLRDNHKLFSPWVLSEGRALFPNATYITLEQNHQIPADRVAEQLKAIGERQSSKVPSNFRSACGTSPEIANSELTRDAARANRYSEPDLTSYYHEHAAARHARDLRSQLDLYDKFLPFLSPISALES